MLTFQRVLFSIVGAFWSAVGVLALTGVVTFGLERGADIVGILLLGNGLAFLAAGWLSVRGRRWVDILALLLVAQNAVFSLLDEVGVYDVVSFVVNVGLLALLATNVWRARRASAGDGGSSAK